MRREDDDDEDDDVVVEVDVVSFQNLLTAMASAMTYPPSVERVSMVTLKGPTSISYVPSKMNSTRLMTTLGIFPRWSMTSYSVPDSISMRITVLMARLGWFVKLIKTLCSPDSLTLNMYVMLLVPLSVFLSWR